VSDDRSVDGARGLVTEVRADPRPSPDDARLAALSRLELAWGVPIGAAAGVPALSRQGALSGRQALERVVGRALARPPCLVSFSGGRDSSAMLALAAHVARQEGLPEPIPASNVFPSLPAADEQTWQELVIRHLGLKEWLRIELTGELDVLGPLAAAVVTRHGALAPFNSHFQIPLLQRASGGSVLTGVGGDEVFEATERGVLARLLSRHRPPSRRHVRAILRAVTPRPRRARQIARELAPEPLRWLRPGVHARIARAAAEWHSREPVSYDAALRTWWWRSRQLQANLAGKRLLASEFDVQFVHPFADPLFLAAYATDRGRIGPPGRTWALRELVGDLLPARVIERDTWGSFNGAFWTDTARSVVERWDGRGADPELVEPDLLRAEWLRESPDWHSFSLAQHLLLGKSGGPA
jgi:asparagine synthetase B (glutamine-hydrolysing)